MGQNMFPTANHETFAISSKCTPHRPKNFQLIEFKIKGISDKQQPETDCLLFSL